jgi:membrane-bound ClpP family serine protease
MTTILLVLLLAALLFFLEVILPGGILGIIGAIMLLVASWLAYEEFGVLAAILVFMGGVVFAVAFFFVQFRILPKTGFGKRAFLSTTSQGKSNLPVGEDTIVGQTGQSVSILSPSGVVSVQGQRHQALSQSGYIPQGEAVEVVGRDAFRLLVRKKEG